MKLIKGDLWQFHEQGEWICITTNGFIKNNGRAVMGRGCALQCKRRYPEAEVALGRFIQRNGNVVGQFMPGRKILCFPTKHNWWEASDLELIRQSACQLAQYSVETCYLPKPGCSNGRLDWEEVQRVIAPILDGHFYVVEYDPDAI